MPTDAPSTKLEAINTMLYDVGERPVNTLTNPSRLDVSRAVNALDRMNRQVQLPGWWFNEETLSISVDGSGYYNLPDNLAKVEVVSGGPTTGINGTPFLVVRGRKLYDTMNATDVFTGSDPVKLEIVRILTYEELPMSAREYIYAMASIRNQSQALGSDNVDKDLQRQAVQALTALKAEEADARNIDGTLSPYFIELMHNR